ncbi:hypothetical protein E4U09_004939 [Claviceps aff. purpurea]|uniref:Uncharacterized protein n=1 Tax=Claviceps aff. purpurea TaxID=1967640 RepID=A0A9P7QRU3_9HYPO|nr:hypothetical protein E4U09_004939 [Claviceps aff. purpurea]
MSKKKAHKDAKSVLLPSAPSSCRNEGFRWTIYSSSNKATRGRSHEADSFGPSSADRGDIVRTSKKRIDARVKV